MLVLLMDAVEMASEGVMSHVSEQTYSHTRNAAYGSRTSVHLSTFPVARSARFCRRCSFKRRESATHSQVGQA
jgi:hypothetical protein